MPPTLVWSKNCFETGGSRILRHSDFCIQFSRCHIQVDGNLHQHRCETRISRLLRYLPNEEFISDSVKVWGPRWHSG